MKAILLFDIDGTLLKVHTKFLKELVAEQLQKLNIDYSRVKNNRFAGRTDQAIFSDLIGDRPDAEDLFNTLKKKYIDGMNNHLSSENVTVFDEAADAVLNVAEAGYRVGLCTGNFREVAEIKLRAAGLFEYFHFGGYGCDHKNRNYLPGEAYKEYSSKYDDSPAPQQFVVIGDTPNDIKCAKYFGARSVAVSTGHFNNSELQKYNPDLVLSNLSEPGKWLQPFNKP